jgi:hypothetical protein
MSTMKKLLALTTIIIAALIVFKAPEKSEDKKEQLVKREEVKLLPVSPTVKKAEELRKELVEKSGTDLELRAAKKDFKTKLEELKEVTEEYNEKAIEGRVTAYDEKQYQVSMEKSLQAFRTYQDAVIRELNLKKEI